MPKQRRNVPPEVAQARARLAGLTARGADPGAIELARVALNTATAKAAAQRWRKLPDAGRMEVAAVILGGGDNAA